MFLKNIHMFFPVRRDAFPEAENRVEKRMKG